MRCLFGWLSLTLYVVWEFVAVFLVMSFGFWFCAAGFSFGFSGFGVWVAGFPRCGFGVSWASMFCVLD